MNEIDSAPLSARASGLPLHPILYLVLSVGAYIGTLLMRQGLNYLSFLFLLALLSTWLVQATSLAVVYRRSEMRFVGWALAFVGVMMVIDVVYAWHTGRNLQSDLGPSGAVLVVVPLSLFAGMWIASRVLCRAEHDETLIYTFGTFIAIFFLPLTAFYLANRFRKLRT